MRRRLARNCVGLVGARAVRQEILRARLLRPVPAVATIKRWVKAAGLSRQAPPVPEKVSYPEPCLDQDRVLHAMDWIARYLAGGAKVFVCHTVDAQTRALWQTLRSDKTVASVLGHVLAVWQRLGLPDFLQLDNDAACTGGGKTPRRFGVVVRLALSLGIALIFTPRQSRSATGGSKVSMGCVPAASGTGIIVARWRRLGGRVRNLPLGMRTVIARPRWQGCRRRRRNAASSGSA